MPDVLAGDVNGDGCADSTDCGAIADFIAAEDGGPKDGDGEVNGSVQLLNFSINFSVNDLDYDGLVNDEDVDLVLSPGDFDGDGDVDVGDLSTLAGCYTGPGTPPSPVCQICDLDKDSDVDLVDFATIQVNFSGSFVAGP